MSWFDWLLAPTCPLCQRPTASGKGCFCRDCAPQVWQAQWTDPISSECDQKGPVGQSIPVHTWGSYGGILRQAIRALKYQGKAEVGDTLGQWLGERWLTESGVHERSRKRLVVVPIPLHSARRQERGYNQAEVISQALCRVTGDRHRPRLLRRVRPTTAQYGLTAVERHRNLVQSMVATDSPRRSPGSVVLVDDILTTGATINAAKAALERQGWQVTAVVVVARATLETSA